MMIDAPGPEDEGCDGTRSRRQVLLYEQAGTRRLVVDDPRFVVPASRGRAAAVVRLQVFTSDEGLRPVAVITRTVPLQAGEPIDQGDRYAEAVWVRYLHGNPQPPIVIMHLLLDYDDGGEAEDFGWFPIDVTAADPDRYTVYRLPNPGGPMSLAEVRYLIGRTIGTNPRPDADPTASTNTDTAGPDPSSTRPGGDTTARRPWWAAFRRRL